MKRQVPMIQVTTHTDGQFYSLDNRRLAVFRLLQMVGKCKAIKVAVVSKDPGQWRRKFDSASDHTRIVVRGSKHVIGATRQETPFPLRNIRQATEELQVYVRERIEAVLAGMHSDDEDDPPPPPRSDTKQRHA
uniref:Uncharacterized protein n=1 Tax=Zooxanthella nutricula TaxID=1333877 RepID=A0A7S2NR95_9DINO|mmetsp:Transcript_34352/g.103706  ORF Transcript_34352/g.103706 Transcript_34352/m.103706 type:complete len:133 (+) Transcript_34352:195-593(+)